MREKIIGAFIAILLSGLVYGIAWAYGQKKSIDLRGWKADVCYSYLADPVVTTDKGESLSRAQLLDILLQKSLQPQK